MIRPLDRTESCFPDGYAEAVDAFVRSAHYFGDRMAAGTCSW